MENRRLEKEELEQAGISLFDERWKSPLAAALGVPSTRIREVMRGARPCPERWTKEVLEILKKQEENCRKAYELIERFKRKM